MKREPELQTGLVADVVKVAGHVRISKEMVEDFRRIREAMSQPISQEDWEAWLAEPDPEDDWFCTDLCDHAAGVFQCER